MENRFDQVAKAVAGEEPGTGAPQSRREALRNVGRGLAGALLASLGLGSQALAAPDWPRWIATKGGKNSCADYCRRFATKAERNRCQQVCQGCRSTTLLCGTSGHDLVCCTAPNACCGGVCTSLATDPANCGACGHGCGWFPNVVTTCSAGTCAYACADGYADCDRFAANGCETHLSGDPNNCGACGNVCGAANPYCNNGVCSESGCTPSCPPGWCGGNGCGGECGCPNGTVCESNWCLDLCAPLTNCDGACIDTNWDALNCGGCGIQCQPLEFCSFGSCAGVG